MRTPGTREVETLPAQYDGFGGGDIVEGVACQRPMDYTMPEKSVCCAEALELASMRPWSDRVECAYGSEMEKERDGPAGSYI